MITQFQSLVEIVSRLRGPNGCPWDIAQSQKSLVQYAIEEAFELAEAIETDDQQEIQQELGDFLFQVVLQSQVAQDEGHFQLTDVIEKLNKKMIDRHPHVFSAQQVSGLEEIWANWEKQKDKEKDLQSKPKPVFSYPRTMPALQAAYKIGVKTESYKFDWDNANQVFEKVREEFLETEAALGAYQKFLRENTSGKLENKSSKDSAQGTSSASAVTPGSASARAPACSIPEEALKLKLEEEIGDLLFSIAQLCRHLDLEPEQCVRGANRKFETRFNEVLRLSGLSRDHFKLLSAEEKEKLWSQAKISSP
ncbi:MAG: MazG family protein [Proteobacteria bacterium]|nr:MazG family protein [Pseudomonadota bacterium]